MPTRSADDYAVSSGPTRMDYDATSHEQWQGHPWLSRVLRLLIFLIPVSLSVTLSLLAAHYFGPVRLGMNRWLWWAMVAAVSTVVLLVADHFVRRLLPLTALLKMTLIFPDNAPSRFGLALRTGTTKQLERFVQQSSVSGVAGKELDRAAAMLELVAALSVHDRLTRGHCERVRAYTDLIIKEMSISEREANLLRWSALLHDVGKLRVPREILTSDQPPTAKQWQVLTTHPAQGMALTATLADWLGEWRRTIGEHHERWDGNGYPARLSRDQIHLGARIVAVADAFDVMTSARSYKKPIPAAVAREEIARCASTQFDPTVVRAFLS
ncbi:MAG: HD-GYP domain-containing protein, partial [Ilumatobacteraceae bacterium]